MPEFWTIFPEPECGTSVSGLIQGYKFEFSQICQSWKFSASRKFSAGAGDFFPGARVFWPQVKNPEFAQHYAEVLPFLKYLV